MQKYCRMYLVQSLHNIGLYIFACKPFFYFNYQKKVMPTLWSWAVLANGTATFAPVFTRLWEIVQEFVPYLIYIGLWALGITLMWKAVKYIMWYLAGRSKRAVRGK